MIKREIYMSRIRPFIGNELIKVLTGIRRSGKSVMLNLIQEELAQNGVQPEQFISLNFENMSNAHLCTAVALHDEILRRTKEISGKVYLFFYLNHTDTADRLDAQILMIAESRNVDTGFLRRLEDRRSFLHLYRLSVDCQMYHHASLPPLRSNRPA